VGWSELGKTPYTYWRDGEPNDIARMCQLIKPWIKLRPKILVALEDIDTLSNIDIQGFESWWQQYSEAWCQHWNISSWTVNDIFSVVVFAQTPNFELIASLLENHVEPVNVLI
jgi:hypothetical protein